MGLPQEKGLALLGMAWAAKFNNCALPAKSGEPRISNGVEVNPPHKYPFVVYLERERGDGVGLCICGGILISNRIVVTAAHCIDYEGETQRVFAGVHEHSESGEWEASSQARNKTRLLQHEGYNLSINVDHDVGLILVEPPFEFNERIAPINMSNHVTKPNTILKMIGWGFTGTTYPFVLREASTKTMKRAEAQPWFNTTLTAVNIVTFDSSNNATGCFGDSGGPLFTEMQHEGSKQERELIGIFSRGNDFFEADCKGPTAFINVSHYYSWILENKAKLELVILPTKN